MSAEIGEFEKKYPFVFAESKDISPKGKRVKDCSGYPTVTPPA